MFHRSRWIGVAATGIILLLVLSAVPRPAAPLAAPSFGGTPALPTRGSAPPVASMGPPPKGALAPRAPTPNGAGAPTWTDLSASAGAPPPRISGGLVYDDEDGYSILFGGEYLNTTTFAYHYYNDTWEFSGGKWTNITKSTAPSPRFGFGIASDPASGEVILFGGRDARGAVLNDTWEFSGGSWSNLSISSAPSPRYWSSMAWDSTFHNVVLFGGVSPSSTDLADTWTFSAGTWTQSSASPHPQTRHGATLMDNPPGKDMVLFGGLGAEYYNDTWIWSAGSWVNESGSLNSTTNPDARVGAGGAYDTALGLQIMYGGYPANTYPYGTWTLANLSWTLYNNLPNVPASATVWNQLAYDAADQWVVYFVPNSNQTFVFNETIGSSAFQASASATPLTGYVPLTVTLSTTISGGTAPYNVTWSLGTGVSTYAANTSAIYSTPGIYALSVTIHDSGTGTYFHNWTVNAEALPLTATATNAPDPAAVGQSVTFQSTHHGGWGPYTFNWSFGDGQSANSQNASHAYASASTYDVSFEVTAAIGGSVYVNGTETVSSTGSPLALTAGLIPRTGIAPLQVSGYANPANGTPPYAYRWSWGDGSATSSLENATHTFTTVGSYRVVLNVSDSGGASVQQSWAVNVVAPLAVTATASTTSALIGAVITFSSFPTGGYPLYTYAWSFDDGATAITQNATHAFGAAGTFEVTVTVTDSFIHNVTGSLPSGDTASASINVTIAARSATGGASSPGSLTGTEWLGLILLVIVLAMLIFFLVWRRRRKQPPAPAQPA